MITYVYPNFIQKVSTDVSRVQVAALSAAARAQSSPWRCKVWFFQAVALSCHPSPGLEGPRGHGRTGVGRLGVWWRL